MYRSPLLDDEIYRQRDRERWYGPPPRPFPPRFHYMSRPRFGPDPYPRPVRPGPVPTYSSRFQLSSYPRELNKMFGALECKLCAVEMNSPIGAKMHYSGRPHLKKVKNYLTEWCLRTGNPLPNLEQHSSQSSVSSLADYCELCDVRLLTTNDKMLHYAGKNHKRNERDPANAKKKGKSYNTIDLSGTDDRFGIGLNFTSDPKSSVVSVSEAVQVNDFVCELCDVKAVSQDQLNMHLGGKKHQDKLKKREAGGPKIVSPSLSILASVTKEQPRGSIDYSMHRTPSERRFKCEHCQVSLETPYLFNLHLQGKPHAKVMKKLEEEYKEGTCDICNVKFNSFKDYQVHVNGKKHEKKLRENALRNPEVKQDLKETITCKNCFYIGPMEEHVCDIEVDTSTVTEEGQKKWICAPCYNMEFDSEEALEVHKKSRRHLLCMLNVEGDKISEDKIHYYCFICRKQYNDYREYCAHLFEYKHMTLSNESDELVSKTHLWHCRVCAIVMDQEAKEEHLTSKRHLLQAAQQDITRTMTELATQEVGTNIFHCAHCNIKFISFIAFSEHMLDMKHLEDIVVNKLVKSGVKIE